MGIDISPGSTHYVIVHGRTVVSDEVGRMLVFETEPSATQFAQALNGYTLDLVVAIPRTSEQLGDLMTMNGLGGEDAGEAMVALDPEATPEETLQRAAEIGPLLSDSAGPACADKFSALEQRLRGPAA